MAVIKIVWIIVQVLIGYNLVLPFILYLFSATVRRKLYPSSIAEADYAVIVTAYEQTSSLPAVVNSILRVNYKNYLIYVVADKCDISNLHFDDERVVLLRPPETLANNIKSHFYAINNFRRQHDRVTIIDSDNLVHPSYLNELNKMFDAGFLAVQGVREAKNLDTTYARLDAARDIYYHYYDGKLLFNLGSSATLAGSGMAFTTQLYRDCLERKEISGAGFDKVLQAEIVGRNLRIAFTESAIVYDEKTTRSDQLVKQRSRWINTWFKYFGFGFTMIGKGISNFSRNQLLFGLILLRPPLFIFLLLSGLFMFINLFVSITVAFTWLVAFILFVLGFYIALAKSPTDKRIYQSLINIPKFIFYQVLSLAKARKANQHSVATQHYHTGEGEKGEQ
ncbi:glycosyltransferase family 2 protein [Mucilaginibacter sp. UR6-1]|uniref:glycosyltransferase n=1 Tax=Mucilaginibacter sp. UR6-1 TaxID=1435643 RepID=UPI001E527094|nr:glycosyltransferase [Mucilaginibacter sp. UR6-1]MCC8407397.1 glycosyltransferase family 2 protein [Mucilaginibacter sp. UR6-1]